jgi:cytochrome c5
VNLINKMLAAQAVVLALYAMNAQASSTSQDAAVAARIQPVGQVCIQGQECAAASAAAAAPAGAAARSADEVLASACNACHVAGVLGAPKPGDSADWQARADARGGLDGLLKSAISGINAMPPKGTCATCTDDELLAAIQKMSGL